MRESGLPARRRPFRSGAALFLMLFCTVAAAVEGRAEQTVQAIGTSVIFADDVASARDRAIADGLVAAVERVVSAQFPIEAMVAHFGVLNQVLFNRADRFVQGFKVLTETRSGNRYRVMVRAVVSEQRISEQLALSGLGFKNKALPTVLVLMVEKPLDGTLPAFWWGEDMATHANAAEQVVVQQLKERGFGIVEWMTKADILQFATVAVRPDFDRAAALALAGRLGAAVVVVGISAAERTPNTMGQSLRTFRGTVSIEAIKTDTGETIAVDRQSSVTVNADERAGTLEALYKAGALAGRVVADAISGVWQRPSDAPALIDISVSGTGQLANFIRLRKALADIPGVRDVQIREMGPNAAVLVLDYEGTSRKLADALMLKTFDSFGINISEITDAGIRLALTAG